MSFLEKKAKMIYTVLGAGGIILATFLGGHEALREWEEVDVRVATNEEGIVQQRVDWLEQRMYDLYDREVEGRATPRDKSKYHRLEREIEVQERKLRDIQQRDGK